MPRFFAFVFFITITILGNKGTCDVPVIQNPLVPPLSQTLEVEEVWRVGSDDDEDFIFGVIIDVLKDEKGNFYLLDYQLNEVFKFSPEGEYLKSICRKGEGPGEITGCFEFFFWNTNTLACFDFFSNDFVCVDLDGIPKDNIFPKSSGDYGENHRPGMNGFKKRDGFFVSGGNHFLYKDGTSSQIAFLSVFDEQANEIFVFNEQEVGYDFNKPITVDEEKDFNRYYRWSLGQMGEVYIARNRTDYAFDVFDTQGNLLRKVSRHWPLHQRSNEEKEEAKNRYSFSATGMDIPPITYKMSDYPVTINDIFWLNNQLWVSTPASPNRQNKDSQYVFDIFDPQGNLLEERAYNLPIDSKQDQTHMLGDGLIMVVTNVESAMRASRDNTAQYQTGEGHEDDELSEDDIALEVILYRVVAGD